MCKGVKPLWNGTQTLYDQYILLYPSKREWGGGLAGWRAGGLNPHAIRAFGAGLSLRKQQPKQDALLPIGLSAPAGRGINAGWPAEPACTSALTGRDFNRSPVHYKKRTASHRTLFRPNGRGGLARLWFQLYCSGETVKKQDFPQILPERAGRQAEPAPSSALTGGTILTQATANTKRINAHRSLRARRIGGERHESGLARPPDGLHLHAGRAIIREKAVSAPVHK